MRFADAVKPFAGQDPKAILSTAICLKFTCHTARVLYLAQPAKQWANITYDECTLALVWVEEPQ